jgi:hypothetical protein
LELEKEDTNGDVNSPSWSGPRTIDESQDSQIDINDAAKAVETAAEAAVAEQEKGEDGEPRKRRRRVAKKASE